MRQGFQWLNRTDQPPSYRTRSRKNRFPWHLALVACRMSVDFMTPTQSHSNAWRWPRTVVCTVGASACCLNLPTQTQTNSTALNLFTWNKRPSTGVHFVLCARVCVCVYLSLVYDWTLADRSLETAFHRYGPCMAVYSNPKRWLENYCRRTTAFPLDFPGPAGPADRDIRELLFRKQSSHSCLVRRSMRIPPPRAACPLKRSWTRSIGHPEGMGERKRFIFQGPLGLVWLLFLSSVTLGLSVCFAATPDSR